MSGNSFRQFLLLKPHLAETAYDKGWDAGDRARHDGLETTPPNPYRTPNRALLWYEGYHDGLFGRPRREFNA